MSVQYSTAVGNGAMSAMEATIGASPVFEIFTGAQPANTTASDSGTKLASITLPADCFQVVGTTIVCRLGAWTGSVSTGGTMGHWRLKTSAGVCHIQGTASKTGDIAFDNHVLTAGQTITIGTFKLTGANMAAAVSSCTFVGKAAVTGTLHSEITDALVEMEDSMADIKDGITDALNELEGVL